ncbi:MAG TPA: NUDIX domain-containing protein [Pyrinomonadaceae bacterium]|nr:NUDIX domain-containing protein [Pyrinomonadaceae bacterium]
MSVKKSAIIPYRFGREGLEILLVTKSTSDEWVIPKGKIEPPLKPLISATKEAFEEAGVLGRPHPIRVGSFYDNSSSEPIPTFLLEVEVELDDKDWLEKKQRSRMWIEADDCADYIKDNDLLAVVKRGIKCLRSNGDYFKRAVKTFCEEHQLELADVDADYAEVTFVIPVDREKRLHLARYDSTVEFSLPGFTASESEDELSGVLSTHLLMRNARKKVGFWCIDKVKDKFVYSFMHNAELKLLDSEHFFRIVSGLAAECEALEELIIEVTKKEARRRSKGVVNE